MRNSSIQELSSPEGRCLGCATLRYPVTRRASLKPTTCLPLRPCRSNPGATAFPPAAPDGRDDDRGFTAAIEVFRSCSDTTDEAPMNTSTHQGFPVGRRRHGHFTPRCASLGASAREDPA